MRNFLYNKSDIIVAVIIVVVAGLIIWFRVGAIMEYPSSGSIGSLSEQSTVIKPDVTPVTTVPAIDEGENAGESPAETPAETDIPPVETPQAPVETPVVQSPPSNETVEFKVNSGEAASTIANNLAAAGLVPSAADFINTATASGVIGRLKAGTFSIPRGSSVDDIIKILTR